MDTLSQTAHGVPFFETGKRTRDLAAERMISEAELLAGHRGPEVVRLRPDMTAIVEALPALGEVMSLTRNEAAVHEKVGVFGGISFSGSTGLVIHAPLDLRLFLQHWHVAFALELPAAEGPRRSIQIFDAAGEAVIKVHLRAASNVTAFERLRESFADREPAPLAVRPYPAAPEAPAGETDAAAFRQAFEAMGDIHEFVPLLRRHGLDRRGALGLIGPEHVMRLGERSATRLLEAAAAATLPIMCFVGNRGAIQIHSGPVGNIRATGPWINVLDPGFDLHLREDKVAEAFVVRKPTRFGLLTSVELYDGAASLVAQFFGVRGRGQPEEAGWRALVAGLERGA